MVLLKSLSPLTSVRDRATSARRLAISPRCGTCVLGRTLRVKCSSPLIKSTTAGRGSWDNGCNVASVGHLYGFGNTLDKALTGVVGVQGAWPSGGRTVRSLSTGKGWVGQRPRVRRRGGSRRMQARKWMGAQYYNARWEESHNAAGARMAAAADDAANQHQQAS